MPCSAVTPVLHVLNVGASGTPLKINTVGVLVHGVGLMLYSFDPAASHGGNENVEAVWRALLYLKAMKMKEAEGGSYEWYDTFHLQV